MYSTGKYFKMHDSMKKKVNITPLTFIFNQGHHTFSHLIKYPFVSCHDICSKFNVTTISPEEQICKKEKTFFLFHRQHLTPCEVELTLSGHGKLRSTASNYWLGHIIQTTNHIFIGGLPQQYPLHQVRLLVQCPVSR